jgi:hypothetical protein
LTGSIKPEAEIQVATLTESINPEIRVVDLTDPINPEIRVVGLTDPIKNETRDRAEPTSGSFCRRNRVRSRADLFMTMTTTFGSKDGSARFLKIRKKWRRLRQPQLSELSNIELAMDMIWSRFRFRRDFTNETLKIGDRSKLKEAD